MRKKIRLKEGQVKNLISRLVTEMDFITTTTADVEMPDDTKTIEKTEKRTNILKEIKQEFINDLMYDAKPCDDIKFYFGEVDEETDEWIPNKIFCLVFRVVSSDKTNLQLKLIKVFGKPKPSLKTGEAFNLYFQNTFNLKKEGAYIKLFHQPDINDNSTVIPVAIDDFLLYELIDNKSDCKAETEKAENFEEKSRKWRGWATKRFPEVMKSLAKTEYTPGLFGMDNIFFFPRGFKAMDDIFRKYNMYVKDLSDTDEDTDKIKFNIVRLEKNVGDTDIKVGATLMGRLNRDDRSIRFFRAYAIKLEDVNITVGTELNGALKYNKQNDWVDRGQITIKIIE